MFLILCQNLEMNKELLSSKIQHLSQNWIWLQFIRSFETSLGYFQPIFHFYAHWKTSGFLMFSVGGTLVENGLRACTMVV